MAAESERSRRKAPAARGGDAGATASGTRPGRVGRKPVAAPDAGAGDDRIERLERLVAELASERDRLKAELANAEARLQHLEVQNKAALDRIDWVIDSLESALDA